MYVSVHHTITDPQKWDQTTQNIMAMTQQGRLPQGLKGLMYLPATDGRRADCVWEANSVEALKKFLDGQTGTAARNEYIPIKADAAFGLPGQQTQRQAA
jgi:hypothetical protein